MLASLQAISLALAPDRWLYAVTAPLWCESAAAKQLRQRGPHGSWFIGANSTVDFKAMFLYVTMIPGQKFVY
jgi:hypothetical protein